MKPVKLPPVKRPNRSRLYDEDFQRALEEHLGDWFYLETRKHRPSYGWARKRIDGLEVSTRKNGEGGYDVYARLVD